MGLFDTNIIEQFQFSMENLCLEMLHQGYEAMISEKRYNVDWKEDKLTVHYIAYMNTLEIRKENQISIVSQAMLYSDSHAFEEDDVATAPRIDFKFQKWSQKEEIYYFAEAKNVSERNWKKRDGKSVNASKYYKRYIETGIGHLVSGYYPSTCVLLAYVVNGDKNTVISELNTRITKDFTDYGMIKKPNSPVNEEYYISTNTIGSEGKELKHLFLQLA